MANRAKERIDAIGSGRPAIITPVYLSQSKAEATGSGLFIRAETSQCCLYGATGFGSRDKSPEAVADAASAELEKAIREGGCVDEYMQDQVRHSISRTCESAPNLCPMPAQCTPNARPMHTNARPINTQMNAQCTHNPHTIRECSNHQNLTHSACWTLTLWIRCWLAVLHRLC